MSEKAPVNAPEKYLLLIVEDPAIFNDWTDERWKQHDKAHADFADAIDAAGASVLASEPLDADGAFFRPAGGAAGSAAVGEPSLMTDGPFTETKEIVLGFYLLEVADEAQARELASLCPTMGYVELRKSSAQG